MSSLLQPENPNDPAQRLDIKFILKVGRLGSWAFNRSAQKFTFDIRCSELFGLQNACELHYQQMTARLHPEDRPVVAGLFSAKPVDAAGFEASCRMLSSAGGPNRWVRLTGQGIFTDAAGIEWMTGVAQDISTEMSVNHQQESLVEIFDTFDHAHVAIALALGPDFIIERANSIYAELTGRAVDELQGKPLTDALPEEKSEEILQILQHVVATGQTYDVKEVGSESVRDGKLQWRCFNFSYRAWHQQGESKGVLIVATDVTQQVLARKALQNERNRLGSILAQMPVGVMAARPDGQLIYINEMVGEIFRQALPKTPGTLGPWPFFDALTEKPIGFQDYPMMRTLSGGEPVTDAIMKIRRGDGSWGFVRNSTVPVHSSTGELLYAVGAFIDVTERKETEKALRESEEKYHALFNLIDQGYYLAEVHFDEHDQPVDIFYHEANPAAAHITKRDFAGKFLRDINPEYEQYWYEIFGRVAKTGQPERLQQHAESDQKWYDFYVFKIDQASNRIAVIFQDITLRKKIEANQEFLAAITQEMSALTTPEEIMGSVGKKIGAYLNVKACLFVDVDDANGKVTVFEGWNTSDVPSLAYTTIQLSDFISEEFSQANRSGQGVVMHDTHTDPRSGDKDYSPVGIRAFITVPFHHHGVWTNYLAVTDSEPHNWQDHEIELFRELSNRIFPRLDRARTEAILRRQEERTRIATEAAELATWEWNLITDEVFWNPQHYRLLGMSYDSNRPQLLDTPKSPDDFIRHVHPDDVDRIKQDLTRAIEEKSLYDADFRIIRTDGSVRWMSGYGRITAERDGKAARFSGVMFDIHERMQAQEALIKADKNKDEFLATLAHELRNPLAPIRNLLQILQLTAGEDEKINYAVSMMNRQVDQLVRLVDDLLDVSRISSGKVVLRREQTDFVEIVKEAAEATRPMFEARRHELNLDLPNAPAYMLADATRLIQIVSNLLNNAAKFTNQGGKVSVHLDKRDSEAILRVRDNGIGIPAADLERIFELFAQSDSSLEKSHGGLGLGLTLVRQLVELHGGQVTVTSEGPNLGSEFAIHLPLIDETPQLAMDNNPTAATSSLSVLVVDDNVDAAVTLQMLLKFKGYQVHICHSGQEAITVAENLSPDVILMDISMPGMNGYDACRFIRKQHWGTGLVIVALTGFGREEDSQLSQQAGFDAHVVKPVDIGLLVDLFNKLK